MWPRILNCAGNTTKISHAIGASVIVEKKKKCRPNVSYFANAQSEVKDWITFYYEFLVFKFAQENPSEYLKSVENFGMHCLSNALDDQQIGTGSEAIIQQQAGQL